MSVVTRPNARANVTPMIDVLLMLLIVFMVVTVQGRRTMDVQLPEPCLVACTAGDAIVLEVLPGGMYRLNHQPVAHAELPVGFDRSVCGADGQSVVSRRPTGRAVRGSG